MKKLSLVLLSAGGIVIAALIVFLVVRGLNSTGVVNIGPTSSTPTSASNQNEGNGGGQKTPLFKNPVYVSQVTNQIAQGLRLTPEQVKTQVQAGKTMTDIATAQGISASQLHTLELNTFQTAFHKAVSAGDLSQTTADNVMRQFQNDAQFMDSKVTQLFGGSSAGH